MHELTDREIGLISREIDRQGLTYTLLKDELLDHICCDIEAEMENGLTFNEAYRKVKRIIGNSRIRQLQDETLYLINKKYRRMKKLMYVLGVAAPVLITIGGLMKIFHWPGAGLLITLALFTTGIVFLPVFVMVRIRDTRQQNEPVPTGLYITGMIAGMVTITGALFKVQHWPGAGIMLTLGLFTLAAIFLPMFAVVKIREAREQKVPVRSGSYIAGVIAGILFIAGALFKIQHWPGAGIVIIVSWMSVAVLFLPLLLLNVLKQTKDRVNIFFSVILVVSFVAVFVMALVRAPSRDGNAGLIFSEKSMVSNSYFLDKQNNRLVEKAQLTGPGDILNNMQAISSEADKICSFIQSAKNDIVLWFTKENQAFILSNDQIDFQHVNGLNYDEPSRVVMIGSEEKAGEATELKNMLESFKLHSLALSTDENLKSFINEQIDLSVPIGSKKSWEEYYFAVNMIQTASNLSAYQLKVRILESALLREQYARLEK